MKHQGFTLVEVIVVAVIVAVLAMFAVQIYAGYVKDSKEQVLENSAANAATFLNTALNLNADVPSTLIPATLTSGSEWVTFVPSGDSVTFTPPEGVTIMITSDVVTASKGTETSKNYLFR